MNFERLASINSSLDKTVAQFRNLFRTDVRKTISGDEYPFIYYADTSKTTGVTQIYPQAWQDLSLEEAEIKMDNFLYENWSPYEDRRKHWPHNRSVIDPANDMVYKIVEFPIVLNAERKLSIKQAYLKSGKLVALSYRLAPLNNS